MLLPAVFYYFMCLFVQVKYKSYSQIDAATLRLANQLIQGTNNISLVPESFSARSTTTTKTTTI